MIPARLDYLIRRIRYKKNNIDAHFTAYADKKTILEGSNFIGNNVTLLNSSLGAFSYINSHSFISNTTIGRYSCIGRDVLSGLGRHPIDRRSVHRMFYSNEIKIWKNFLFANDFIESIPVQIGSDVWIGARVIIMDGVSIGHGAIVAAGSVVTSDIDPYTIVAGSPARKLRSRFSTSVCNELLTQRWWEWNPDEVHKLMCAGEFNNKLDTK